MTDTIAQRLHALGFRDIETIDTEDLIAEIERLRALVSDLLKPPPDETKKPSTSERVPGHTLRGEGMPYCDDYLGQAGRVRSHDSRGFGLCSCGAKSDWLDSNGQRQRWHREHKAAMLALGSGPHLHVWGEPYPAGHTRLTDCTYASCGAVIVVGPDEPVAMEVQDPAGLYRPSFAGRSAGKTKAKKP